MGRPATLRQQLQSTVANVLLMCCYCRPATLRQQLQSRRLVPMLRMGRRAVRGALAAPDLGTSAPDFCPPVGLVGRRQEDEEGHMPRVMRRETCRVCTCRV